MLIVTVFCVVLALFLKQPRRSRLFWGLQHFWTRWVSKGLMGLYNITISAEGLEELKDEPFILLIKHTSMADTTLPLHLFSIMRGTFLRYVLKEEMLNDPLFNIVARYFPNIFVRRGSGDAESQYQRIEELSKGLNAGEGIVIFPEGTRYSDKKCRHVKEKLKNSDSEILRNHAASVKSVLPLRTGGALALMKNSGDARVIICGHVGFEGSRTMRNLWNGMLIDQAVRVKFWVHEAKDIPTDEFAREKWLFDQWEVMDEWVTEQP
jgi:1-acyl-sn-glycerol-3-phosphate acyltransferase